MRYEHRSLSIVSLSVNLSHLLTSVQLSPVPLAYCCFGRDEAIMTHPRETSIFFFIYCYACPCEEQQRVAEACHRRHRYHIFISLSAPRTSPAPYLLLWT
ncbi:hypothetical protein EDB85DRAFT_743201 [Lactarius pseudohatsudake]|nr:hypothetical protein EDB85DRAFT_743201 [Lactarius pseudohatsudake]